MNEDWIKDWNDHVVDYGLAGDWADASTEEQEADVQYWLEHGDVTRGAMHGASGVTVQDVMAKLGGPETPYI